jgi:hypothetical protein
LCWYSKTSACKGMEDNIKPDLKKLVWMGGRWMELAQDRVQ